MPINRNAIRSLRTASEPEMDHEALSQAIRDSTEVSINPSVLRGAEEDGDGSHLTADDLDALAKYAEAEGVCGVRTFYESPIPDRG